MNRREYVAIAERCMVDDSPLPVTIDIKGAWFLVTALQLAARHPAIGSRLKKQIQDVGRQFQGAIEHVHPEAHELLEKGWHSRFDIS